jgi:hypothetical protein
MSADTTQKPRYHRVTLMSPSVRCTCSYQADPDFNLPKLSITRHNGEKRAPSKFAARSVSGNKRQARQRAFLLAARFSPAVATSALHARLAKTRISTQPARRSCEPLVRGLSRLRMRIPSEPSNFRFSATVRHAQMPKSWLRFPTSTP